MSENDAADCAMWEWHTCACEFRCPDDRPTKNTDRELFREGGGDGNGMSYYEPSIHVTESGSIGMNVGGHVITMPIREWHALAAKVERLRALVRLLYPDEMTPTAKRELDRALDTPEGEKP